jgi:hypothetical protein
VAINLNTVTSTTAVATVTFGDQSMPITYRPGLVTQARMDAVTSDSQIIEFLAEVLVDWDLRSGTGKAARKMAVNTKNLNALPFTLTADIFRAIASGRVDPEA